MKSFSSSRQAPLLTLTLLFLLRAPLNVKALRVLTRDDFVQIVIIIRKIYSQSPLQRDSSQHFEQENTEDKSYEVVQDHRRRV